MSSLRFLRQAEALRQVTDGPQHIRLQHIGLQVCLDCLRIVFGLLVTESHLLEQLRIHSSVRDKLVKQVQGLVVVFLVEQVFSHLATCVGIGEERTQEAVIAEVEGQRLEDVGELMASGMHLEEAVEVLQVLPVDDFG